MRLYEHIYGFAMLLFGATLGLSLHRCPAPPPSPLTRESVAPLVCALVELRDASKLPDDTRLIVARALDHASALGF